MYLVEVLFDTFCYFLVNGLAIVHSLKRYSLHVPIPSQSLKHQNYVTQLFNKFYE